MFCFTGRDLNPPEGSAADAVKQKEDDGNLSLPPSKYHCCVRLNVPEGGSSSSLCFPQTVQLPGSAPYVAAGSSLCSHGLLMSCGRLLMSPRTPYV